MSKHDPVPSIDLVLYTDLTQIDFGITKWAMLNLQGLLLMCVLRADSVGSVVLIKRILPAQNMLFVILTDVDLRQIFCSTMGSWICWRADGKFLAAGFQVSLRFPQPVTLPL